MTFYDKEYYDKVVLPMKKAKAKKEENVNNGCLGIILLIILSIVIVDVDSLKIKEEK